MNSKAEIEQAIEGLDRLLLAEYIAENLSARDFISEQDVRRLPAKWSANNARKAYPVRGNANECFR